MVLPAFMGEYLENTGASDLSPYPVLLIQSRGLEEPKPPLMWLGDEETLWFGVIKEEGPTKAGRARLLWQVPSGGRHRGGGGSECSLSLPPDSH